jgi:hypothetical protein
MRAAPVATIGLLVMIATACGGSGASLQPAVSQFPAAGVCLGSSTTDVVTFTLDSDVPRPRCGVVRPDQRVRFVNDTSEQLDVKLLPYDFAIAPGQSVDTGEPVGKRLAPGVHRVTSRLYAGTGPELVVLDQP